MTPQLYGLVPCIYNCTPCDLWILANNIVFFLTFYLATPVLVVALLAGGLVLLSSSGNPERIKKGKNIITFRTSRQDTRPSANWN